MDIIELAQECGAHITYIQGSGKQTAEFFMDELQQFTQRIEQPHKQRIAELEKDCDILATNYDAARRASRFSADVADQALADLKAAEQQIEQLQNQITKISEMAFLGLNIQVRKALKELCDTLEQTK